MAQEGDRRVKKVQKGSRSSKDGTIKVQDGSRWYKRFYMIEEF